MNNNTTIMLTGAHGFVGARVLEKYPDAVVVPGELVRDAGEPLAEFVRRHGPAVIVNAAAISDIGTCERDPEASYAANVTLPVVLAKAARETGAKLISFSSDQVYTGCTHGGPYREDEALPAPANVYARHKLEAEARVLDIAPDAALLRATWMYDMPKFGHANRGNFLTMVLHALMHREKLRFFDCEFRGITYVRQVAELLDAVAAAPGGVYNYGSENPLSMYDTVLACLDALGCGDAAAALAERMTAAQAGGDPHNLWMDGAKQRAGGIVFDTTAEGFVRCAKDYFLQ